MKNTKKNQLLIIQQRKVIGLRKIFVYSLVLFVCVLQEFFMKNYLITEMYFLDKNFINVLTFKVFIIRIMNVHIHTYMYIILCIFIHINVRNTFFYYQTLF